MSSTTGAFLEQVITATLYRPSAQRHGYSHSGVPSDVKVAATSWPNKTRWIGSKILSRGGPESQTLPIGLSVGVPVRKTETERGLGQLLQGQTQQVHMY